MRRALSIVAVLALLAMLLPMSVMAARDGGGGAAAHANLAIMRRRGIERILAFDRAFDRIDGISRIGG